MKDENREDLDAGGWNVDILALLKAHGVATAIVAAVVAAVVGVGGVIYLFWGQNATRVAHLEFRLTFDGADQNRYPNGLPFALSDVTAASVMDSVFEAVGAEAYCDRVDFRRAFIAETFSDESLFLDLEYRDRLSERGIEWGDRRQLEEDYAARRAALPLRYRLLFVDPSSCSELPEAAVTKAMESILSIWANESDSRRGVLNHQVQVLSPATLDVVVDGPGGWVLGADLLRNALVRLVDNVEKVRALPGASLVRFGEGNLTFSELSGKLQDLLTFKLEPLVLTSGQSLANQSLVWVNETVASAEREERLAQSRVDVYRDALREFSGDMSGVTGSNSGAGRSSQGNQGVSPQIDRSFVDRIVEMSIANAPYRQSLTEAMVTANLEAVEARNRANYYRRLVQSLRSTSGPRMTPDELTARLGEVVAEGKALATQFGQLYEEFSRVSIRPAGAMYETIKPVSMMVQRGFTRSRLIQLIGVVFVAAALVTLAARMAMDRLRYRRAVS